MKSYLVLFVLYILAPKINLIEINDAGIRPEDFITLFTFILYISQKNKLIHIFPNYVKSYIVFIMVGFVSAALNFSTNGITGFIFTLRLIEYFVWFLIGCEMSRGMPVLWFRNALLVAITVLIAWGLGEYAGLIGKIGRFDNVEERLTINTSGPFETSVMLAVLAFAARSALTTPLLIVLIWLTQARVTLVASAISLLARRPGQGVLVAISSVLLVFVASGPLATVFESSRFAEAQGPVKMFETLQRTARTAPLMTPAEFQARFLLGGDMASYVNLTGRGVSFNIRAIRWSAAIKSTCSTYFHMLFGWGPGAWGLALDGHYVRAFAETGIIGLFALLFWIATMMCGLNRESIAGFMIVMLTIIAVFIDIFSASKAIPVLWVFAALDHMRHPHSFPSFGRSLFGRKKRLVPRPVIRAPTV